MIHPVIKIVDFDTDMVSSLWEVFYSSIHNVCVNNYSIEQVNAWAPKDFDPKLWREKMVDIAPCVALIGPDIGGYADLQSCGKIDHFFVHGAFQRRGVGSALMVHLLSRAQSNKRIYSEVSHTAKGFFEKHGFSRTKVQTVCLRGVEMQNNCMEKTR